MLKDCRICDDPYLADLPNCPACGALNPDHREGRTPWRVGSEQGLYGLAAIGTAMAVGTGFILLVYPVHRCRQS